jgi:hypothetical protein
MTIVAWDVPPCSLVDLCIYIYIYVTVGGTCCPCILQVGDGDGNVTPKRAIFTASTRIVRKRGTNKGIPYFLAHECVPSFTLRNKEMELHSRNCTLELSRTCHSFAFTK